MTRRWRQALVVLSAILVIALGIVSGLLPAIGAGGLLHPWRRHLTEPLPPSCRETTFVGDDVALKGWHCRVSPAHSAVLLVHGSDDVDTRPDHSQRVLQALAGPKRLILVPGARHNESLRGGDVWAEIERWIDSALVKRRSAR